MAEPSLELFNKWRYEGNPVKFKSCDNAGEKKSLQKRVNSADWKLNITFEYSPRDTPQHYHLAKSGLASIAANIPMKIGYELRLSSMQQTRMDWWLGELMAKLPHVTNIRTARN
jgi:hypothetical protein